MKKLVEKTNRKLILKVNNDRSWDMAGSTLKKPIRGQIMGVGAIGD